MARNLMGTRAWGKRAAKKMAGYLLSGLHSILETCIHAN